VCVDFIELFDIIDLGNKDDEMVNIFGGRLHEHGANVNNILKDVPCDKSFEKVSDTFQLISDPSRLKILWLLCHCELCVNNIAIICNMTAPAVSHHLKMLKQAELVDSRRAGKEMYYRLSSTKEAELVHKAVDDVLDVKCPK